MAKEVKNKRKGVRRGNEKLPLLGAEKEKKKHATGDLDLQRLEKGGRDDIALEGMTASSM